MHPGSAPQPPPHRQFLILRLAPGLLRYDSKHTVLVINLHSVLKNKNVTSLCTPLIDLLRGARKADRAGFAARGLADAGGETALD